ncbi:MAG TPA: aminoglycoside phosphotransferase family protein [Patescibacteria group bacterium]|nr:aminoglycoside phosphotransferase family protein [Patescibacteria group bacterium]
MTQTVLDVENFLKKHTGVAISGVTPIGKGEWSSAYSYQQNGFGKVIRFSRFEEDYKKDRFASGLSSQKLPIPPIEEIGQAFNNSFAISPRVEGKMIDELTPFEIQKVIPAFLELLDSLRSADVSKTTGFGSWDGNGQGTKKCWNEFILGIASDKPSNRIAGWKEKLAKNKNTYKIYSLAYDRLTNLISYCPNERYLVHNDLLHTNLIVNDNKIAAVIDWGCALYGDFLYDLAMYTLWQFYYPSMAKIDFKNKAKNYFKDAGADLRNFDQRLKCYELHLALDSIAYNSFKENRKNVDLTIGRIKEILA